jgi:hypothetical protein
VANTKKRYHSSFVRQLNEAFPVEQHLGTADFAREGVSTLPTLSPHIKGPTVLSGVTVEIADRFGEKSQFVSTAAAVPREPGKSEAFLSEVKDFTDPRKDRKSLIDLFHRIYRREGMVNNAVNKSAALVGVSGSFEVKSVRGQRGRPPDKQAGELLTLLNWWASKINARAQDAVKTGDRGVGAFIAQGVRLALIEGDHIGRTVWTAVEVPALKKKYALPMNLQSFSAKDVEIPEESVGTNAELIYWAPPRSLIQKIRDAKDPEVKKVLDKLIPQEVQNALIKDGKWLLDPDRSFHIKHRGIPTRVWGESMIEAAMTEIAYKRALQALDIVTIENLINRLVIVMVGSDDPDSLYHRQEVSQPRMTMLAQMMRRIGPSATIIWPGPDIKIEQIGAHNQILEMDERYQQAEARIRNAIGVPAALLSGEASDGKAAGWAAIVGLAAELTELQNQYGNLLVAIGEMSAEENGFQDADIGWSFSQDLLVNKEENVASALKALLAGSMSWETFFEQIGLDFPTEETRMAYDVEQGYRELPFGPPRAAEMARQEEGGRPPNTQRPGEPDPRTDTETQSPEENK